MSVTVYCWGIHACTLQSHELYDTFFGLVKPLGTLPMHCRDAIERLVREAASARVGKQGCTDAGHFVFHQGAYDTFRRGLVSAVADGGTTEQHALHECTPGKKEYTGDILCPNCTEVSRDRAHRLRSVQKGVWREQEDDLRAFLDLLVTGERSLARMLQTSEKFQNVFQVVSSSKTPHGRCRHTPGNHQVIR